jgi:hypothetical protein
MYALVTTGHAPRQRIRAWPVSGTTDLSQVSSKLPIGEYLIRSRLPGVIY